jgi:hypothetical protein
VLLWRRWNAGDAALTVQAEDVIIAEGRNFDKHRLNAGGLVAKLVGRSGYRR